MPFQTSIIYKFIFNFAHSEFQKLIGTGIRSHTGDAGEETTGTDGNSAEAAEETEEETEEEVPFKEVTELKHGLVEIGMLKDCQNTELVI